MTAGRAEVFRRRAVLLILVMVAGVSALAPRAFAQMTSDLQPVDWRRPHAGNIWRGLNVETQRLVGKLMVRQSFTLTSGTSANWRHSGILACPWPKVTPVTDSSTATSVPITGCQTLKRPNVTPYTPSGASMTVPNFVPTQAMIDNGGVVIRVTWNPTLSSMAPGLLVMTEWVPLVPPASATLVLTPTSISENGGVATVTLEEATTKTYTVTLATEPTADVAVTVATDDLDAVTVAPTTLTFTATGWNTPQSVTVMADEDMDNYRDKTVTLTHMVTSSDTNYASLSADVRVTVKDKDTPLPLVPGTTPYNGGEVTFKRAPNAAEVEVTLPRTLNGDVPGLQAIDIEVTREPNPPAVAADGSVQAPARFSLGPAGARTVFEITVSPKGSDTRRTATQLADLLPGEGIKVCLPVSPALRAAAEKVGKMLEFLHYQDGAWSVEKTVQGPPDTVCARLKTFSHVALAFKNLAFQEEVKPQTYFTGREVNDELPRATGGNPPLRYELAPALPDGLTLASARPTITGTPTKPTARKEYTLTATDKNGDTATLTFTREVKPGIQSRDLGLVLAGVGRTLASDAVEILGGRFGSSPASRLQVTLGGQALRLTNPTASPSPSSSSPSPLAGEGQGEGGILRGENALLPGKAQEAAGSPSPWQQATGLALSVARALGVNLDNSPSPLAGEGRGEGVFSGGEGAFLQNETTRLGRLPTDLRRTTTTSSPFRLQPASGKDLLARSAFELPLTSTGENGVPAWTLWGRGSAAGFSGQPEAGFKMDGTLYSGYVGVDYRPQSTVLMGLALAHSTGEVNYERTEDTKAGADVELTSVLPYAHWQPRPGLGVWGLAGAGWGEMDLKLVGDDQTYTTRLTSWLGAVGGRQALTTWQGIDLAAKTDAFLTTVRSAGKTNLPAARGHAQRVRLLVEGRTAVEVSSVSRLEPRLELGGRWDNGTAEQGLGAELGGGVAYTRTDWGLSVDAQGRYLLLHEDGAFEDWGASVSVRLDPGVAGEGAYLTVAPVWGQASSGVDQLWSPATALSQTSGTSRPATGWQPGRLEVDLGYGLALADGRGFLTPYGGLALAGPGSSRYRLGSRLALSSSLDVTLEGERAEQPGQKTAHGVSARLGWQW